MTTAIELLQSLDLDPETLVYCEVGPKGGFGFEFYDSNNSYTVDSLRLYFEKSYLMEKEKIAWRNLKALKNLDFYSDLAKTLSFIKTIALPIRNNNDYHYSFDKGHLVTKTVRSFAISSRGSISNNLSCLDGSAEAHYAYDGSVIYENYYYQGVNLTSSQKITTVEQLQNYLLLQ